MISSKKIKQLVKKENKKIGKKSLDKIEGILEKKAGEIIKNAIKKADFFGRKIIKIEDISDEEE